MDRDLEILLKVMLAKLGGGIVISPEEVTEAHSAPSPIIERYQDPFMMKVRFPE